MSLFPADKTPGDAPDEIVPASPEEAAEAIRAFEDQKERAGEVLPPPIEGEVVDAEFTRVDDGPFELAPGDAVATNAGTVQTVQDALQDEIAAAEALLPPELLARRRAEQAARIAEKVQQDVAEGENPFEETIPRIDRSTLERFAKCPHQGVLVRRGPKQPAGEAAAVGTAIHEAISRIFADYVEHGAEWKPRDVAEMLEAELMQSPPDVQAEVMDAMRGRIWDLSRLIAEISPANIIGFDGGKTNPDPRYDKSGQLSHIFDFPVKWKGTLEFDLIHRTPAPTVLQVTDYKSGHAVWTPTKIAKHFQFRFGALIVFQNFPEVQEVHFVVWAPRRGGSTQPVVFKRERMREWMAEVHSAAVEYFKHKDSLPELVPALPGEEKCSWCPVKLQCRKVWEPARAVAEDPAGFADRLYVIEAALKEGKKLATAYIKQTGDDIRSPNGPGIGYKNPKKKAYAPTLQIYGTLAEPKEGDDGEGGGEEGGEAA